MGEPTVTFEPVELEAWREQVRRDLGGRDPASLTRALLDGVSIDPLYVQAPLFDTGVPGAPPFVRGSELSRSWRLVQELGPAPLHELRVDAERALREGADEIWLGAEACRAFGRAHDLDALRGLGAPVRLAPGVRALPLAAAWLRAPAELVVHVDPLGALATEGRLGTSIDRAYAHLAEALAEASTRAPIARPVLVSGVAYHEAGLGAVEELGVLMATGIDYLRGLSDAGHPLADVPRRTLFELAVDADFFVGVAKLRAARLLWSKVLRALGIDGPEQGLRVRARTSLRATSALDPRVNLLRSTGAAFGAVVGGADLVTVLPYDVLSGSGEHGARLARNTQLLMREESHLGQVLDPAGGSYFLESLTDRFARGAWAVLQEIEHLGGVSRGLVDGSLLARASEAARARREAVASRRRVLVGVNRYPTPDRAEPLVEPAPVPLALEPAPEAVRAAAAGPVLGALAAAVEVSFDTLILALGEGDEPARAEALVGLREAAPFERLRERAARLTDRRVQLFAVGELRALGPRVDFAREALAVGGLELVGDAVHPSAEAALEARVDARIAMVCAADEAYGEILGVLVPALVQGGVEHVVVAARPTEALRQAGVSAFVHRGGDLIAALEGVLHPTSSEKAAERSAEEDRP